MDSRRKARIAYVNILARDIVALSNFYSRVFDFAELETHRSPIYRCLDGGGVEFGFNADEAYDLLSIGDRRPSGLTPVAAYFTIEVSSASAVEFTVQLAGENGGRVIKAPYKTYYNAWQAVLADPEGNIFRVNHRIGPRATADSTIDRSVFAASLYGRSEA
jgi:predicted enzyme related to lactoylglutathione lyase